MSEQDFQDQLSDEKASALHADDVDPEAVVDETDEPEVDDDREVPEDGEEQ